MSATILNSMIFCRLIKRIDNNVNDLTFCIFDKPALEIERLQQKVKSEGEMNDALAKKDAEVKDLMTLYQAQLEKVRADVRVMRSSSQKRTCGSWPPPRSSRRS